MMGVKFSDLKRLESTANALGGNMFEGFKSTPKEIEIIRILHESMDLKYRL